MNALRRPKVTRQIRVIRISRPSVIRPIKREDSRIPSSVDSWLSSVPSIKQSKSQNTPKQIITEPKTTQRDRLFCRGCIIFSAVIIVILIIGSIVGIVLAVKLQPSATTSNPIDTFYEH